MKFPKGTEHLERVYGEAQNPAAQMFKHIIRNISVGPNYIRQEIPTIVFLFFYNEMKEEMDRAVELMEKHFGKHGYNIIIGHTIENEMDIKHVERFWKERSAGITTNLTKTFENCNDKYLQFFTTNEKFLRQLKNGAKDAYIRMMFRKFGARVFAYGFESQHPPFLKACAVAYKNSGDDIFLSPTVKDVFLF